MTGILQLEQRITRLRQLRDRIDAEISADERILGRAQQRRQEAERAAAAAARRAQRAAEDMLLEQLAPPAAVRAWATARGLAVATRGRLPQDIRTAYINHHAKEDPQSMTRRTWATDLNTARLEDLTFLADTGETLHRAAQRLGTTTDALEKWCRAHDQQHLYTALLANTRTPGHGARHGHLTHTP